MVTAILKQGATEGIVAQLRASGQTAGEELARELLKSPEVKAELEKLTQEVLAELRAGK